MTYRLICYLDGNLFLLEEFTIIWLPRFPRERVRPDVAWVATQAVLRDCPLCRIRGPPKFGRVLHAAFSFV